MKRVSANNNEFPLTRAIFNECIRRNFANLNALQPAYAAQLVGKRTQAASLDRAEKVDLVDINRATVYEFQFIIARWGAFNFIIPGQRN